MGRRSRALPPSGRRELRLGYGRASTELRPNRPRHGADARQHALVAGSKTARPPQRGAAPECPARRSSRRGAPAARSSRWVNALDADDLQPRAGPSPARDERPRPPVGARRALAVGAAVATFVLPPAGPAAGWSARPAAARRCRAPSTRSSSACPWLRSAGGVSLIGASDCSRPRARTQPRSRWRSALFCSAPISLRYSLR